MGLRANPMLALFGALAALATGTPAIHRTADASRVGGANKHSRHCVAMDKRAAVKARNKKRGKR